jgi:protease-4
MFREPTDEELAKEKALIDDLYGQFLDAVMQGRRMDQAQVKQIATGEVFTGRRSKELGLVDELGDLERAIDIAAELGNTPRRPIWTHPKRTLREVMSTMVAGSIVSEIVMQVEERVYGNTQFYFQHRM